MIKKEKIVLGETVLIKKNQMFFDSVKFVAAARMPEKERGLSFLFYNSTKGRLWATDGFRLHIAGEMGFGQKDCYFKVISEKKNEIMLEKMGESMPPVPNIAIILQKVKTIHHHDMSIARDGVSVAYSRLIRLFKKATFNFEFINDLKIFPESWTALIQGDEDDQQFFKAQNCLAVIMPLNV